MRNLGFSPSPLTLGAVQLGLPYGVANVVGQPNEGEARDILETAVSSGISVIDTARAYGNSEERIGAWRSNSPHRRGLHIITKTPPLEGDTDQELRSALRSSIVASCQALQVPRLDVVLVHRETDLLKRAVADALVEAAAEGLIGAFGASLYRPDIGLQLIETVPVSALQVPGSLVDDRFQRAGVLTAAKAAGVAVFVRSIFLQGALLMEPEKLAENLNALAGPLSAVREFARKHGRTPIEVLILAMRDMPGVSSLVVGVERATQLPPLAAAIRARPLDETELEALRRIVGQLPDHVINPSAWPR
jgi:aryl-alcohol dehydrogenase-like predicted oxidoreductase